MYYSNTRLLLDELRCGNWVAVRIEAYTTVVVTNKKNCYTNPYYPEESHDKDYFRLKEYTMAA